MLVWLFRKSDDRFCPNVIWDPWLESWNESDGDSSFAKAWTLSVWWRSENSPGIGLTKTFPKSTPIVFMLSLSFNFYLFISAIFERFGYQGSSHKGVTLLPNWTDDVGCRFRNFGWATLDYLRDFLGLSARGLDSLLRCQTPSYFGRGNHRWYYQWGKRDSNWLGYSWRRRFEYSFHSKR